MGNRVLNFAIPQQTIEQELELRLKLRLKESSWVNSILHTVPWIEALDPIKLRNEQWVFYKAARYFVHHFHQIPEYPFPKNAKGEPHQPLPGYPPELCLTPSEAKGAIEWFNSPKAKGSGRTYLLGVCFIEMALANIEWEICLWDHSGEWSKDAISSTTRDIVWDVLEMQPRIVCNAGRIIAAREGATEINKQGVIGNGRGW
jgi:hypothetical protein